MKCISLWQPWATLMAIGAKRIETRSWPTSHRGPLAIHAAKKRPSEIPGLLDAIRADWPHWSEALRRDGCVLDEERKLIGLGGLPYGAIVAVVHLDDCFGTHRLRRMTENRGEELDQSIARTLRFAGNSEAAIADALRPGPLTPAELAFGDYRDGRYGWCTSRAVWLPEAIPFRGAQGLFEIPDDLVSRHLPAGWLQGTAGVTPDQEVKR